MFADLLPHREQSHWETHPFVYIRSNYGVYRYEIDSSYLAVADSVTYGLVFPGRDARNHFLKHTTQSSVIRTGVQPELNDRILTLSTCSGKGYTTR